MAEKATNQDWLDQVQEEALEPELPIIDPHHHLWDQKVGRVNPKYFLEEMLEDTNSGHNIVATVFGIALVSDAGAASSLHMPAALWLPAALLPHGGEIPSARGLPRGVV